MIIPKYKYVDIPLGEPEPEYYSDKKEMKKAKMKGKIELMKAFKKMKKMMYSGLNYQDYVYEKEEDDGYGDDGDGY